MKRTEKEKKPISKKIPNSIGEIILQVVKEFEEESNEIKNAITERELMLFKETFSYTEVGLLEEVKNKISIGPPRRHAYAPFVLKVISDIEEIKFNQDKLQNFINSYISKIKSFSKEEIDVGRLFLIIEKVKQDANEILLKIDEQASIMFLEAEERESMGDIQKINLILKEGWEYYKRLSYVQRIRLLLDKIGELLKDYHTLNVISMGSENEKVDGVFDKIVFAVNEYEKQKITPKTDDEKLEGLSETAKDVYQRIKDKEWKNYDDYMKETGVSERVLSFAIIELKNKGLVAFVGGKGKEGKSLELIR